MNEILDPELAQFVDDYVDSFTTWDLLVLFSQNPGIVDTAHDIATFLGRRQDDIEAALDSLVRRGLVKAGLESGSESNSTVYSFDPESELASQANRFVDALRIRSQRLSILTRVLRKRPK